MAPTTRKKVRLSLEDGPDVTSAPVAVRVGQEPTTYYVHETLLCSNSMFFTKALKKEWKEGETRQVDLPDIKPVIFEIWVKWLYTGRLCYSPADRDHGEDQLADWLVREWYNWRDIYALADFLQDADLKDAAIDAHIESMLEVDICAARFAKWVYPHSTTASAHRSLAVDLVIETWDGDRLAMEKDQWSTDFCYDIVMSLGPCMSEGKERKTIREVFRGADRCKYHDHGDEKPCYKTRPTFTL